MSLLSMLFGGKYPDNECVELLSPEEYKSRITNNKVQLIDVRTPREYNTGHIKSAKNIDFYSRTFKKEFEKLEKDKALYIYCRTGSRSRHAANKLVEFGFKEIYDLKGGIVRWK